MGLVGLLLKAIGLIALYMPIMEQIRSIFQKRRESKENHNTSFLSAVRDLDYNMRKGIGNAKNPFRTDRLSSLLQNIELTDFLKDKIEDYIYHADLCNTHGGLKKLEKNPGQIKQESFMLKELLIKECNIVARRTHSL